MSLTKPFINNFPAFNANEGISIEMNVLGGDAINGYQFSLYSNDGSQTPFYTSAIIPVTNDIADATIRSFPIQLTANIGNITNNNNYKIEPKIFSLTNTAGLVGTQTLFTCYTTPQAKLKSLQLTTTTTQYMEITKGSTFTSSSPLIRIEFNANDLNSPALPNIAQISLYGIDDNNRKNFISITNNIYNFQYDNSNKIYYAEVELGGLSVNVGKDGSLLPLSQRKYTNYQIEWYVTTLEDMTISGTIENINCYYEIIPISPLFKVYNVCQKGVIQIISELAVFFGQNTPANPIYIDGKEIDLTSNGSNVIWPNYFNITEPYTLRLWGRNFNIGIIAELYSTDNPDRKVILKYDSETINDIDYNFISLEAYRDSNSKMFHMFPYYIESQRIPKSSITKDTNLFIGIQEQEGLFDIDFEIIND